MQRVAFPHIIPSEPSALNIRIRKSALSDGIISTIPSAPTPVWRSLSLLDKLILLDIYPAREEPIEGVSSEMIFKDVTCPEKVLIHKDQLMDYLKNENIDILMTMGAGDIDRFIQPIVELLEKR